MVISFIVAGIGDVGMWYSIIWRGDLIYTWFILVHRPQVMLGVTNPFFVKTLDHWPHVIRLADTNSSDDIPAPRSRSPGEGGSENKPGIHSKYKPFLNRDKSFAKLVASIKVRQNIALWKNFFVILKINIHTKDLVHTSKQTMNLLLP